MVKGKIDREWKLKGVEDEFFSLMNGDNEWV